MTSRRCESLSEDETDLFAERLSPRRRGARAAELAEPYINRQRDAITAVLSIATGCCTPTNAGNPSVRPAEFSADPTCGFTRTFFANWSTRVSAYNPR